jgi:hypothetical protein
MTIQLVRKSPIGKMNSEHLKIVLAGSHTMKQKACMLMQVRFSWVTSALRNICPNRAAHALEYRSVAVRFGQRNRD